MKNIIYLFSVIIIISSCSKTNYSLMKTSLPKMFVPDSGQTISTSLGVQPYFYHGNISYKLDQNIYGKFSAYKGINGDAIKVEYGEVAIGYTTFIKIQTRKDMLKEFLQFEAGFGEGGGEVENSSSKYEITDYLLSKGSFNKYYASIHYVLHKKERLVGFFFRSNYIDYRYSYQKSYSIDNSWENPEQRIGVKFGTSNIIRKPFWQHEAAFTFRYYLEDLPISYDLILGSTLKINKSLNERSEQNDFGHLTDRFFIIGLNYDIHF